MRIKHDICDRCKGKGKVNKAQALKGVKYEVCEVCKGSGLVERTNTKHQIKVSDMTLERLGVVINMYKHQGYRPNIKRSDNEFYLIIE